jgi:hypothetical protein
MSERQSQEREIGGQLEHSNSYAYGWQMLMDKAAWNLLGSGRLPGSMTD